MTAKPTTSRPGSRGFTLVEMLMAMLVMTVGLLGLLQAVQSAYRQVVKDRVREEAVILAEEQMHDWRRDTYQKIAETEAATSTEKKVIGGTVREFTVLKEVEQTGTFSRPVLKMRLSVSWTIQGATLKHDIYTLKSKEE